MYKLEDGFCLKVGEQQKDSLLERCPPLPECIPGCVNNQGKCINGMCICEKGFAGDQCEIKLKSEWDVPDFGPPRPWQILGAGGEKLKK